MSNTPLYLSAPTPCPCCGAAGAIAAQAPTVPDFAGLAHQIYSAAQLAPGEGVIDGVDRIVDLLGPAAQEPLTDEQVHLLYLKLSEKVATIDSPAEMFTDIVRDVECALGITGAAK